MNGNKKSSEFRGVWAQSHSNRALARVNASFKRLNVEALIQVADCALPDRLVKAVLMARFVSAVLASAHHAQHIYGVPAALLIAIASEELNNKPLYGGRADRWFLERARHLAVRAAEQPKDSYLRLLLTCYEPETFLHSLMACDAFHSDTRERMVQTIKDCHLLECNVLTDTPPDSLWRRACKKAVK